MSDIFREVDEEVRQEQIVTFLKRYGKYLAAVIVLAIALVAGYRYFQDQQRASHAAQGNAFEAAVELADEGKATEALPKLQALAEESGSDSYGLLGRFRIAELQHQAKDSKAAQATYDAIVADSGVDQVYRDLAGYYAASLMLESGGGPELEKRLEAMSGKDNVWHLSVTELRGLNQYKMGQREAAVKTFKDLLGNAPADSGFKLRAQQMLAVLGVPADEIKAQLVTE
ncbi:tetratricopeptide repeat protein [Emcibacter sp. SYSU 3D8]|uniref:tetratricopeptide repeat protein n=1 Tax=Emcibacter sp. SYSU 3D8 TaxID=3133969 RepID=UPI0031FE642F